MNTVTLETKNEAETKVDRAKRYAQIMNILSAYRGNGGLTAKEVAVKMKLNGFTPTDERNFAAPRLTELVEKGRVVITGTKLCNWTGRKVATYAAAEQ